MRPDTTELSTRLVAFAREKQLDLTTPFDSDWRKSGVYAVLDCVLSSMTRFDAVVVPALARFAERSRRPDTPELTFSSFLDFVRDGTADRPSPERFEVVATEVFGYRGKIAQRLKVEVAYDVCAFFVAQGCETKANLRCLMQATAPDGRSKLEILVMDQLAGGVPGPDKVRGIGLALGAYLMICLGDTSYVKPDTLLLRRVGEIGGWTPKAGDTTDFTLIRAAVTQAGQELGISPAHLEHLLWKFESRGEAEKT